MKRAGIVMMGLLLPLGQAWSSEAATTSGWQVTPFFGYSSAIDFEKGDEVVQPAPLSASLDSLQGQSSGSWGLFISKEVDDPGM
ncbi:TPA: outer membrane beta-barrel protein, partial [Aeromonas veronii]